MKTKIIAAALFAVTVGAVAGYPVYRTAGNPPTPPEGPVAGLPHLDPASEERPAVEVVFVLDTTSSMSGLIDAAKEKIWSIATTMARAQPAPDIRMGLVAYRDRGDRYVTRVVDLSSDLDTMYATLMDFRAEGGGDAPESVNQALRDAVHRISWSRDQDTYRVVFLVGDAPPHMDYHNDVQYPESISAARAKGIVVNTIQCGQMAETARRWQQMAALGQGRYLQVGQGGSAVAITTPFDDELAELSASLDETRLYYGSPEEQARQERKLVATRKLHDGSSKASRARRAAFNASASGRKNLIGEQELVDDVVSGEVDLSKLDADMLPESVRALPPAKQKAMIEAQAATRAELESRIRQLVDEREAYLRKEVEESGGAAESLDNKLYDAIRAQAGEAGLRYAEEAPAY